MDHAGHSQLSAPWNPTGTFSERERTLPSQSNNSLIALETLKTTAAMEAFLPMPSSTSDMLEVFNLMSPIPTLPRMDNAFSEEIFLLPMLDTEASISPKVTRTN